MNRKQHWEGVYANKSPLEVSWFQKEPSLSLELIRATGIGAHDPIIDVGGGASVLVDRLLAAGYCDLSVLDLSGRALEYARERLGERADRVAWIEADATEFEPPKQYEVWHDRAVFHFLTEAEDRRRYVEALSRALLPGGHLVIAAFAIDGPKQCSDLPIVQYDVAKMSAELGSAFQLQETREEVHVTPTDAEQRFAYFRYRFVGD